jgi:NADH-quinone oxidoreductase subunit F
LDLHRTPDQPTSEEKAAIDSVLGNPESGWDGGSRQMEQDGHVAFGGHESRGRRHLLLPVLHAVQDRIGWISPGALNYVSLRLDVAPAEVHGVASFYAMFSLRPSPTVVAHVCDDIACILHGAGDLCNQLEARLGPEGDRWHRSPCLGLCERAPAALVVAAGEAPTKVVL